ncbi:MAG TPA: hypothetical protein VGG48_12105 [Rhizomicrobium sp.]|jgi:hypothetical protein
MAGAAGLSIVDGGEFRNRLSYAPRIEKARQSSDLRNDSRDAAHQPPEKAVANARAKLSQFETNDTEPLWNGPQLNAGFVAQLIGQMLVPDRGAPSAPMVYRKTAPVTQALVFDDFA